VCSHRPGFTDPHALDTAELPPIIYPTANPEGLQRTCLSLVDAVNDLFTRIVAIQEVLNPPATTLRLDAVPVFWLGNWMSGREYFRGDMVFKVPLLMVANKTTTDTPSMASSDWDFLSTYGVHVVGTMGATEPVDIAAFTGVVV